MAETNFQSKTSIDVGIGNGSIALGTKHPNSGTYNFVQVTDFNIEAASAPIDVAPSKNSVLGQLESQGHHRPDTQMYEATLTMRGTPTAVLKSTLALFGSGSSAASLTPASNTNDNSSTQMKDGGTNVNAVTLAFMGAGSDVTSKDVIMPGCMATSMTLRSDVGTNGGELEVETQFMSGYQPIQEDFVGSDSLTRVLDTAAPKNIFNLSTSTLDSQVLVLQSYEIVISRPLARVHHQNTSDYKPFGYVQNGPYEVTGTLVAKRDNDIHDLDARIKGDSAGIALSLAESSGYTLSLPTVMIDNSKPEVGDFLLQNIPFRAFAASESASIISITIS